MVFLKVRKLPARSLERQILDSYREGFHDYLRGMGMYFRKINLYLKIFDKRFTTANISSYRAMKIPQIKIILDQYAKQKSISLNLESNGKLDTKTWKSYAYDMYGYYLKQKGIFVLDVKKLIDSGLSDEEITKILTEQTDLCKTLTF